MVPNGRRHPNYSCKMENFSPQGLSAWVSNRSPCPRDFGENREFTSAESICGLDCRIHASMDQHLTQGRPLEGPPLTVRRNLQFLLGFLGCQYDYVFSSLLKFQLRLFL